MSRNNLILVLLFIGAAALTFILTYYGLNRSSSEEKEQSPVEEVQISPMVADNSEYVQTTTNIDTLLANANKAIYEDQQIMLGVQTYKRVLELDSNNLEALYQLGILSIQSNQLEKAAVRFKKLILLQPQNQEYKDVYQSILDKLKSN